jgi:hypothetical protein
MTRSRDLSLPQEHSAAWVFQTWASFLLSTSAMAIGIAFLPVGGWMKGYMGVGFTFSIASTMSLSKTVRDIDDNKRLTARVDGARVEKLLSDHHPLK